MTGEHGYQIVGHINPTAIYPAYVIPVVSIDGTGHALFLSREGGPDFRAVSNYVSHTTRYVGPRPVGSPEIHTDRLFAFGEEDCISYSATQIMESGYARHSRLPHILWLAGPPAA